MSNVIPITVAKAPDDPWANKTNGMIFEFKEWWEEAWKFERRIEKLAVKFGGQFVGT